MDLSKLLKPVKIAVVGASERKGSFAGDTCRNLLMNIQDKNRIYFINPKRSKVYEHTCYPSLGDLPEKIDLLVVCTPMSTVEGILLEGKEKGAGAAVVFASGYSEVGTREGKQSERSLAKTAEKLNMAVMGPNCAGFANILDGIHSFGLIYPYRDRRGKIGFVSQSGQFCQSLLDSQDMFFSYLISAGNSTVVRVEDYMDFLVDDEDTKVVSVYIEGGKDTKKFAEVLKKAAVKRKPVIILKAGKSKKGSRIAASHTGSLAGSDRAFDAVLDKFGAIRVEDMEELKAASLLFETLETIPSTGDFAAMNLSGGETGICADLGSTYGIRFPDFEKETLDRLKAQLPSYATPNNPLDMTATLSYDAELYAEALRTVMRDTNISMVLIGYTIPEKVTDPAISCMYEGIQKVMQEEGNKPVAVLSFLENSRDPEYRKKFREIGVPILPSSIYAFKILGYMTKFIAYHPEEHTLELLTGTKDKKDSHALSEFSSKQELRFYGVPVPEEFVVHSTEELMEAIEKTGFPAALKIESADILHKSDVGGVMLNIQNKDEAKNAYETILKNVSAFCPKAEINGVLLAPMLPGGTEFIIGINDDPQFGLMLLAGMGGIFVDLLNDTVLYPLPVNRDEALMIIEKLRAYPLLKGYRGGGRADIEALADAIVHISKYADANREILKELDLNPVFIYAEGKGIGVADALIIKYCHTTSDFSC